MTAVGDTQTISHLAKQQTSDSAKSGALMGRKFNEKSSGTCCGLSFTALLFVLGVIFWAVGASEGIKGMVVAGKVFFSFSVIFAAISVCKVCCAAAILGLQNQ